MSIFRYELKMAVTDSTFVLYSQSASQRESVHPKALRVNPVRLN